MVGAELAYIASVVEGQGPGPGDYADLMAAFDRIHRTLFVVERGISNRAECDSALPSFFSKHRDVFRTTWTMQGFVHAKPHGYAGDFELIERIYAKIASQRSDLVKWDTFFHESAGSKAVRDRSNVLSSILKETRPKTLLSVGCGPALDVCMAAQQADYLQSIAFLDNDEKAISRAKLNFNLLCSPDMEAHFIHKNALRFRAGANYDLIWSSGLFDYLSDKAAATLLKRLRESLRQGGMIAVGNFAHENPSRSYMEVVGDWFLIHRGPADLMRLAAHAGFERSKARVIADETGINLFLIAEAA